jgi:hypothetical protein
MSPKVNKWKDFLDRVGWTAIQTAAGAAITELTGAGINWATGLKFVGITTAIAVLKVVTAQNVGSNGSGDAIPGGTQK